MTDTFTRNLDRIVDWVTRERHIERKFLVAGTICLAPLGWGLGLSLATNILGHDVTINAFPSLPDAIQWLLATVGAVLVACAAAIGVTRYFHAKSEQDRQRVFVIEQRGLRDTTDTPLIDSAPSFLRGRRESLVIDLRERIKDGEVTNPEKALERVATLPMAIERMRSGIAAKDISTVYGGLSPVPFTFLAGLLLDDESHITIMDWDRNSNSWRLLDGEDDGSSFAVSGLDPIPTGCKEVAIAVSVSYAIDINSVQKAVSGMPIVELLLSPRTTDGHWSEEKQQRLARDFLTTAIRIADFGVQAIHLFIAAPSSVVFRLGRVYDKRNLPRLHVYQYQKGREIEHPWAVEMPVQNLTQPRIQHTSLE